MDDQTKQALEGISKRLEQFEARVMERFGHIDERFDQTDERIHDTETRVLRAFHAYASTTDLRLKELPLFSQRLEVLEGRIGEVERKLLDKGL